MLASRKLGQGAVSYLTRSQFYDALLRGCPAIADAHRLRPTKLGVAVSGGADSMALTFLCHQLTVTHPRIPLEINAFIVDHKLRPESEDEAWRVKGLLWKLDITSRILTLPWPHNVIPSELPNVETQARRLRYRALGRACVEMGIENLLVGHHQDDQIENVFMRVLNRARGSGLKGIPLQDDIPECEGIFGAHQSGHLIGSDKMKGLAASLSTPDESLGALNFNPHSSFSDGGVKVCRPLLPFTKPQILATCEFYQIPFETDQTNFDRTLTRRNTIRYLFGERKLPKALQPSSMLSLVKKKQSWFEHLEHLSKKLLEATTLLEFNPSCAYLEVCVPSLEILPTSKSLKEKEAVCGLYLRNLASLVSPRSSGLQLSNFGQVIPTVFPELGLPLLPGKGYNTTIENSGLLFVNIHEELRAKQPNSSFNTTSIWRISPAPFSNPHIGKHIVSIPPLPPRKLTSWFAWGSFWIRLFNRSRQETLTGLTVRPFRPNDVSDIGARLLKGWDINSKEWDISSKGLDINAKGLGFIVKGLNIVAKRLDIIAKGLDSRAEEWDSDEWKETLPPVPIRYTLPAIAQLPQNEWKAEDVAESENNYDWKYGPMVMKHADELPGKVMALPTLLLPLFRKYPLGFEGREQSDSTPKPTSKRTLNRTPKPFSPELLTTEARDDSAETGEDQTLPITAFISYRKVDMEVLRLLLKPPKVAEKEAIAGESDGDDEGSASLVSDLLKPYSP